MVARPSRVVLKERIAVHSVSPDFASVHLERPVETFPNPEGVCAISRYRATSLIRNSPPLKRKPTWMVIQAFALKMAQAKAIIWP